MNDEFETLVAKKRGRSTIYRPKAKVIPSGVVLRLERDENCKPSPVKARLVALSNFQNDSFSSNELYAYVACIETVRVLLSVAATKGCCTRHLDIKVAFLYAPLDISDTICMKLSNISGIKAGNGRILKLNKSLYGLRQAPKLCYKALTSTLKLIGFRRSMSSECFSFDQIRRTRCTF